MVRLFAALLLAASLPASAALLPERWGDLMRSSLQALTPPEGERPVWREYGLQAAESGEYRLGASTYRVTAYQLQDTTGALAAFQWLQPEGGVPALRPGTQPLQEGRTTVAAAGNYVLRFENWTPTTGQFAALASQLPNVSGAAGPLLQQYLPRQGLIPGSERYSLGPDSMRLFVPSLPAEVAGFDRGAEVQFAQYRTTGAPLVLALFSYPTPQMARGQLARFLQLPGVAAKRSSSLVVVVPSGADAETAQALLDRVNLQQSVTWSEPVPKPEPNAARVLLDIFKLAGILVLFCALSGVTFGLLRQAARRWTGRDGDDTVTVLGLRD